METCNDEPKRRAGLYRSLSKKGDPRLTTLLGVARALGYKISIGAA